MYDPKREYRVNKENIDNAIQSVLDHGLFINGPEVKELENSLSEFVGSNCVCVSNGTDALKIALLALDVQEDDEVITVAHSWISTVEVISILGAKPVFVDIESDTFNIDVEKIEDSITDKTKAIIVVSLYGQIPDMDTINQIADKYNLPVIEDGAQSFGATYKGRKSCSLTTIGTTSFFPSKPLGCYGDGGACFTNDKELEMKIRAIKNHGGVKRFHHKYIGLNARLDTIQAAILNVKFKYFEETIKKRNDCANYYLSHLKYLEKDGFKLPVLKDECQSVWAQFSILAPTKSIRDRIVNFLKENNINVAIFYPSPLHTQDCFKYLNYQRGALPITEDVCDRIFNLPCYGELKIEEQEYIIKTITDFYTNYKTTIIINSYNPKENELLRSINSCLNQIDVFVRLIVSTVEDDNTIEIVNKLNNPKIKLVVSLKSEHPGKGPKGIYYQLNKALEQVNTRYVSYFSSNDKMLKTKSINEISKINENNSIFCFSCYNIFYIKDKICYKKIKYSFKRENMTFENLLNTNFVNDCATIDLSKLKKPLIFNYNKYENLCFYNLWLNILHKYGIESMSYNDNVEWDYYRDLVNSQSFTKTEDKVKNEYVLKERLRWEFTNI